MNDFIAGYIILFIIGVMICIFSNDNPEDIEERDALISIYLIMLFGYTILAAILIFGG